MEDRDLIRSATRVLTLLEVLNRLRCANVAELQAETGLPKPTLARLLHTLVSEGYLRKLSRTAGYALTERVLRLSEGYQQSDLLVALARRPLEAFTARYKWLTNLQTYDRGAMRGLFATTELSPLASDPPAINRRSPMLTTAHGQTYLALCPEAECEMILAMLRASKNAANAPARDRAYVDRVLADVRRQGYALRPATPRDRVIGFAVPVLSERGVAATVGMRYFGSAMPPAEAVRRYLEPLREIAAEIAAALEDNGDGAAGTVSG